MSWIDAVKNAVLVDPGTSEAKPAPKVAPPTAITTAQGTTVTPADAAFVEAIRKAVFSKRTALTTLLEAAEKLEQIIPDQATRFKAAYATAGNGRTVQEIKSACDIHLNDVDGEVNRFKDTLAKTLGREVEATFNGIAADEQAIQNLNNQLESIKAALQERAVALAAKHQEHTAKSAQLLDTEARFTAAANEVRSQIEALRTNVTTSLT